VGLIAQRFPALANRNYRIFWIGQFVSLIGSWMQATVQPYLAYRLSGQPFYLGLIGFAATVPALLVMLPGGVIIEQLDKRKTLMVMLTILMLQAFTLAYLALSGLITIWHIIILAFINGIANSLEITARQSMIGELVDRSILPNAIALNSMIFNAARVLGPTITAPFLLLLGTQGEGYAFLANGVSYLFVLAGLFMIRTRPVAVERHRPTLRDLAEGLNFVRQSPIILGLILMVTIPGFFGFPAVQQLPVFARDVFAVMGEPSTAAAARNSFLVTSQGVGALVAAVFLASVSGIRRKALLLTIGQFAFALGLIGLSLSRAFNFALAVMLLVGWGTVTQLTLTNTLIQLYSPDDKRGRIISIYFWALQGIAPFGSLLIGWMAQSWSAPTAVLISGSICLVGLALFHLAQPAIRRTVT
jgi:MFS family permease